MYSPKRRPGLPSIPSDYSVYVINKLNVGGKDWNAGSMHTKLGVSWNAATVCVGDNNHEITPVSHAGINVIVIVFVLLYLTVKMSRFASSAKISTTD